MCLIVLAYRAHPDYPVIIAANRDEFYARPTAPLKPWGDDAGIVAGRDLEEGGTWMGLSRRGRLAAVTNFREPDRQMADAPSRGHLTGDYLKGSENLNQYLNKISSSCHKYNGYNLILSENNRWVYTSNRGGPARDLEAGIHGLSNHLLNTPWPKVKRSCQAVENLLGSRRRPGTQALLKILQDRQVPPDDELPRTGIRLDWERRLGAVFIHSPDYGTRSSTVVLISREGLVRIRERSFDVTGVTGEVEYELRIPLGSPPAADPPMQ